MPCLPMTTPLDLVDYSHLHKFPEAATGQIDRHSTIIEPLAWYVSSLSRGYQTRGPYKRYCLAEPGKRASFLGFFSTRAQSATISLLS